jgi:hypothetical protein
MYHIVRVPVFFATAIALAACQASQSGTAPVSPQIPAAVPAAPTASSPSQRRHHLHYGPNDVVGGGPGRQGQSMAQSFDVNLEDAGLPNGSGIAAINIGVDQIMVTDFNGNITDVAQYSTPHVVNVMAYQGGNSTPIAQGFVAPTTYASLTIVVDTATSAAVTAAGTSRTLSFLNQPTQSTSGFGSSTSTAPYGPGQVAITYNSPFKATGRSMNLDVDFNVMESIVPARTAYARPSVSVAQEGYEGSISGNLQNASGSNVTNAVVVATAADGSVAATAFTDANGNFLLHTLVAGSYQLTVYNQYVTAAGWSVNAANPTSTATVSGPGVSVTAGQSTQVGTIAD